MQDNQFIPSQEQEMTIHDYLQVILRRRRLLLIVFIAISLGVTVQTFRTKHVYEANTTLHIRDDKAKLNMLPGIVANSTDPIDAELEILKSRSFIEQVVARLRLVSQVSDQSDGLEFKLLEFTSTSPNYIYKVEITGPDTYQVKDRTGKVLATGKSGVLLQSEGFRLLLTAIKGRNGDGFRLNPPQSVSLQNPINAAEVRSGTHIIRISYADTNPRMARDVVNTLAQIYIERNVAYQTQESSKTLEFIEDQMKNIREDLDESEKNLQIYKSSSNIMSLDAEAQKFVANLTDVEATKTNLEQQKKQLEFELASTREAITRGKVYYPADAAASTLAAKLGELETQKRSLLTQYTNAHPQVSAIQAEMDDIQKRLVVSFENKLKGIGNQEKIIDKQLSGYESEFNKLPLAERELARLMRHTKVNAEVYTFLLQRYEEARIAKASAVSNISVIDPAITPSIPIRPNRKRNILMGMLFGLMAGVGVVFFQEYLDDTIKDAEAAHRILGVPVLAIIPFISRRDQSGNRSATLTTQTEPRSAASESFRSLRTSIHFSAISKKKQVLLISSCFPGEGKTTIISNLAVVLVQTGAKVLLIDGDLRRPALHQMFGHTKAPGLTEILAGDTTLEVSLHNTGIAGLDFLSAGTSPPNPAELLGSEQMAHLLGDLRGTYDFIMIDAPPVLAVTDAPLLTSHCDLVILAMETERVPIKAALRMAELLANVRAPVAGLVINDKSGRSRERYGYYGDYYGYGYYGEVDEHAAVKMPLWRRLLRK